MLSTNEVQRNIISSFVAGSARNILDELGLDDIESNWEIRDLRQAETFRDTSNPPGPWHNIYIMVFESIAQARELLPLFSAEGMAKRVLLAFRKHANVSILRSPELSDVESMVLRTVPGRNLSRVYDIYSEKWLRIHQVLCSVVSVRPGDTRALPLHGKRLGVSDGPSATWAVGDPLARWIDLDKDPNETENVSSIDAFTGNAYMAPLGIDAWSTSYPAKSAVDSVLPPIDSVVFSPANYEVFSLTDSANLRPAEGSSDKWALISVSDEEICSFRSLDEVALAKIRMFRTIAIRWSNDVSSFDRARLISQLAVSGVLVKVDDLNDTERGLLGPEVSNAITSLDDEHWTIPSKRESDSIVLRRAALKAFSPGRRLRGLGLISSAGLNPTVSVLLVTKRYEYIPRILTQISGQTYRNIEIVLVLHDDHDLSTTVKESIDICEKKITFIQAPTSITFGMALNMAAEAATGPLVTKMDDDDWYGPHHIEDLVLAREYSGAQLVGCPVEFTYLEDLDITTRRSFAGERYADHVAGGTIMISKADLLSLGGWRSASSAVDRALLDAALMAGMSIYRNHGQNYVMHRRNADSDSPSHTWNIGVSVFLNDVLEQWSGLVFPPQFDLDDYSESTRIRSKRYRSVFSREADHLS